MGVQGDTNPLWQYSLSIYEQPGVGDYCVKMQDRYDILVNLMLFVCWVGARQFRIKSQEIKQAESLIFDFNATVTKPIRIERRKLVNSEFDTEELKKQLLERELQAEFREQHKLYHWFCQHTFNEGPAEQLVEANLRCYFDNYSIPLVLPNPLLEATLSCDLDSFAGIPNR